MMNTISVGISDLKIAQRGDLLVTYALGSCVGICIYDTVRKIAGLSHIMLPSSIGFNNALTQVDKFADLAIPKLVEKMEAAGAKRICMKAKIAGGAQMFAGVNNSNLANIGARNVIATKEILQRLKIPLVAEDVGKNYGRTQYFDSATGSMRIVSISRGEWSY